MAQRKSSGRSTYATLNKGRSADRYGKWDSGRQLSQDEVAGHLIWTDGRKQNAQAV